MANSFVDDLRGWKETEAMSDDARRKVWLMHTAAERIDKLEASLRLIAANKGKTIYSHDAEYRLGANAAFEQCAEIAEAALSTD